LTRILFFPPILVCHPNNQYYMDDSVLFSFFSSISSPTGVGWPLAPVRAPPWDGPLTEFEWQPIPDWDYWMRFSNSRKIESLNSGLQIFGSPMPRSIFSHARQILASLCRHVMQSLSPRAIQNWGLQPASKIGSFTTILTILDDQNSG
jgi:hypothetical protein